MMARFDDARDGRPPSVGATFYCKCADHPGCTERLVNLGREGHTHLSHMARRYNTLSSITIFLNGGVGSANVAGAWHKRRIADQIVWSVRALPSLAAQPDALWTWRHYFSDGAESFKMFDCATEGGGCSGVSHVGRGGVQRAPTCSATELHDYCASDQSCQVCTAFEFLGCGSYCVCDNVGVSGIQCSWHGGSSENVEDEGSGALAAAEPPSLAAWACAHWGVSPDVLERCHWQWTASFAVGAANILARPRSDYENGVRQLEKAGVGGGLAVHFMERLWRSIFFCSLGGACVRDTGDGTGYNPNGEQTINGPMRNGLVLTGQRG